MAKVPRSTGNLAYVLERGGYRPQGRVNNIFMSGIGSLSRIGNDGRSARGTIKKFLQDYPRYRLRGRNRQKFRKSQAWWMLSGAAKAKLQELREQGLYGGAYMSIASGKAAYFYPQEGSREEWAASAARAEINPTNFIEEAIQMWTADDHEPVLASMMAAVIKG